MQFKSFTSAIALLGIVALSMGGSACSASSQGSTPRSFDSASANESGDAKSLPTIAEAPTLNLDLSVDAAYAAIPHRRSEMDFAASKMPDQDKRFLEVAFHLIDQAIRLRVTAYQKFSRGENGDTQLISDMDQLVEFFTEHGGPSEFGKV
jgi:hypothetical protein